jgi:multidrug efflux pump
MISHFFIDRPIFASVLSIVLVLVGVVALSQLPIAQYPEVAPPTVQVSAIYPGANAQVVGDTVAFPIEQEVNGVENMLYMSSQCTNDGQMYLNVTFALGTDLNMAQVLVQNRVSVAEAKLPEEVKRQGVTTKKKSPSILLCVNLTAPGGRYNQLYLSNFATTQVKDALSRIKGVGDVTFLGPRDYSMRIWLDPEKLARLNMTPDDVMGAIREQNVQVAAGRLGQAPTPPGQMFQLTVRTLGRLTDVDEFKDIVVKVGEQGEVVKLKDVVTIAVPGKTGWETPGVELGAKNYDVSSYLDRNESVTLAVFQLPGSNAIETAGEIRKTMEKLKASNVWKEGIEYHIVYDTTVFVEESIEGVFHTLIEAFVLVFIVVLIFLQTWRATVIPMVAVPVSLVGTFAFMALLGFSLNNLSLFGMVLAIGIVVDDAIVVVENVETHLAKGMNPRDAARKAMDEVTGPVIAIALVLCAVFVPTAFMAGISGQFYKQFALTIAVSTVISAFNSLTLSPALCVLMLKPHGHGHAKEDALPRTGLVVIGGLIGLEFLAPIIGPMFGVHAPHGHDVAEVEAASSPLVRWLVRLACFAGGAVVGWFAAKLVNRGLGWFFVKFNSGFDTTSEKYSHGVGRLIRIAPIVLLVYVALMGLTFQGFRAVPVGFIPEQDKGYLVVNAQLPDGASLERTEDVIKRMREIALETPGVGHTISVPGYSIVLGTNLTNVGGMFVILKPFEERKGDKSQSAPAVTAELRKRFKEIQGARVAVFGAPPVDGLGSTGGFKLQVQDRGGSGPQALEGAVQSLAGKGNDQKGRLTGLFTSFTANQPQVYLEIDRVKVKSMHVDLQDVFNTLQAYLGSSYVNDFTRFNRNWQVNIQADARYRLQPEDIGRLEVRNKQGERVPLSTLLIVHNTTGPAIVNHYNMYPSAEVTGNTAPGTSSGQAINIMNALSKKDLPPGMEMEWTELTLQQILAGEDLLTKLVFPLAVVFVFLTLAAQYESWALPLAIILIVPMCLLAAIAGVWLMGLDNNIFTQIGLVVLIGLAAKNAILIVEFAKEQQGIGLNSVDAAVTASRMRLRPILMTSFAFILGVVPLVLAKGAGAEMRYALGVAVFSGMLGVTLFGIFFTPVFYVVVRWLTSRKAPAAPAGGPPHEAAPAADGVAAAHGDGVPVTAPSP